MKKKVLAEIEALSRKVAPELLLVFSPGSSHAVEEGDRVFIESARTPGDTPYQVRGVVTLEDGRCQAELGPIIVQGHHASALDGVSRFLARNHAKLGLRKS